MRKLSLGLGILALASIFTTGNITYASTTTNNNSNLVTNKVATIDDRLPVIIQGKTLAPFRFLNDILGVEATYIKETKKIEIVKGDAMVEMFMSSPQAKINNKPTEMGSIPIIKNDIVMVPLKFVAEAFQYNIKWDVDTKTLTVIDSNGDTTTVTPIVLDNVDRWDRKIRKTNLPKNAQLFPYVVEGMPNWVYESIRVNKATPQWEVGAKYNTDKTPKQLWEAKEFDYDGWVMMLENDLDSRLNIDYRTLDADVFANTMEQLYDGGTAPNEYKNIQDAARQYVSFIKQYKIITKGEFKVLPETFWQGAYGDYRVNAYVKFTIVSQPDKSTGLMYDEFGAMTKPDFKKVRPKESVTYEGVVQIGLSGSGALARINYSTSDIMSQIMSEHNLFGGVKPANQPSVKLK